MAASCWLWRPDRGRCLKTYGILTVLLTDLVFQCVNGTFIHLFWYTVSYKFDRSAKIASTGYISASWLASELPVQKIPFNGTDLTVALLTRPPRFWSNS